MNIDTFPIEDLIAETVKDYEMSPSTAITPQKPSLEMNHSTATLLESESSSAAVRLNVSEFGNPVDSSMTCLDTNTTQDAGGVESSSLQTDGLPEDEVSTSASCHIKTIDVFALISKEGDDSKLFRHGISRYAPYGTRFAAEMKDGTFKTSHIAGDLANRARSKTGKGGRVDLVLVTHDGEREQLDAALHFFESVTGPKPGPSEVLNHLKSLDIDWDYRKGDGVKLLQRNASNFFKRMMEHAKRVSHPLSETFALPPPPPSAVPVTTLPTPRSAADPEVRKAAAILQSMMLSGSRPSRRAPAVPQEYDEEYSSDESDFDGDVDMDDSYQPGFDSNVFSATVGRQSMLVDPLPKREYPSIEDEARETDWTRPMHVKGSFFYEVAKNARLAMMEEREFYSKAAESFDWSGVEDVSACHKPNPPVPAAREYYDTDESEEYNFVPKKQKLTKERSTPRPAKPAPKPFTSSGSVISTAPPAIRKGREGLAAGVHLKGLSRHSPYGTRFCAQMPNGEVRESYLAGDLADRVRTAKGQGELLLVLHGGEIDQLQSAWEFVMLQDASQIGAGQVLDHLRELGLDENHRKPGSKLLQKNAGNFFKRVQEYGRRKLADPNYLSMNPTFASTDAVQ
ncbi:hypothetical protein HDU91_005352 [Kappamyces sp. JEL0680]|nr:hypothetical protein HDU91_005352 [Kappamyces sp. JEL0680]